MLALRQFSRFPGGSHFRALGQARWLSSRHSVKQVSAESTKESIQRIAEILKDAGAENTLAALPNNIRKELVALDEELTKESQLTAQSGIVVSRQTLIALGLSALIPAIGFGFVDNFIMIIAGEYIDTSIGVALGVSTMAAAGLGNMVSDVAGVGLQGVIEQKFNLKAPHLSRAERALKSTKLAEKLGTALGIAIGCLIGMVPLFFMNPDKAKASARKTEEMHKIAEGVGNAAADLKVDEAALLLWDDKSQQIQVFPADGKRRGQSKPMPSSPLVDRARKDHTSAFLSVQGNRPLLDVVVQGDKAAQGTGRTYVSLTPLPISKNQPPRGFIAVSKHDESAAPVDVMQLFGTSLAQVTALAVHIGGAVTAIDEDLEFCDVAEAVAQIQRLLPHDRSAHCSNE